MFYEKDTIYMTRSVVKNEIYRKPPPLYLELNNNNKNHDGNDYIKDFYDDAVIFVTG